MTAEGQTFAGESLVVRYVNFVKLPHTLFALPFALLGVLAASFTRPVTVRLVVLVVVAFSAARWAAMGFNRIVDRDYDARNPRTRNRELVTGAVSLRTAWTGAGVSLVLLILAAGLLNPLCLLLSPLAVIPLIVYPYAKRFTNFPHYVLALAQAVAPVGAWLAVTGTFAGSGPAWVLGVAVGLWIGGFDIIYALQDYDFDRAHGLHSLVVAWGPRNALQAAFLSHLLMCGALLLFGLLCRFRVAYLVGWFVILCCLLLEHWIARRRSLNWINVAFFRLNALVSAVFFIVVTAEVVFQGGFRFRLPT